MLSSPLSRFAVITAAAVASVRASQCVVFDASWNLYALNVGGADYNLGTSDNWSSKFRVGGTEVVIVAYKPRS